MKMEEDIRQMLLKGGLGTPPPSLDLVIMQKIRAEQDRRIYRRVVTLLVLKILAVFALLAVTVLVLWLRAGRLDWAGLGEQFALAGLWIKDHLFLAVGGMIALIFAGAFKFGRA